ncbi:MAG: zinc-dependent metalloprotease [Actinobacteria bacterium]|nr:MAG: zinc-dependent metalloprotease [Actinomycetota bacterium]
MPVPAREHHAGRVGPVFGGPLVENDIVTLAAERLVDWRTAALVGRSVAGAGGIISPTERAQLAEDIAEVVPEAERLVEEFTELSPGGQRSRGWVMSREQWLEANLRGFERMIEPFARKLLTGRQEGALATVRRAALGAQLGGLLGYLGHRVLGQYDILVPPDDEGLIYFVGPNIVGVERKFSLPARQFRTSSSARRHGCADISPGSWIPT